MKKIIILLMISFVASIPIYAQAQWTKNGGVNIAQSKTSIPAFPRPINGYISASEGMDFWNNQFVWKGSIRIFEGQGWSEISGFPNTMNHCNAGIFMIRWRSDNPNVRIASTIAYSKDAASGGKTGKFGYMYGTNCEQPMFKFNGTLNGNDSSLADIYYELKFYKAIF